MKFSCLASGSKGNSLIVKSENTSVLVDCGISLRELEKRLKSHFIHASTLDAVLVTHEHDDHISGIKSLCTKYKIPLYVTEAVYKSDTRLQAVSLHQVFFFEPRQSFDIKDISVEPFTVPHDAVQTVGLRLWNSNSSISIVTDIGDFSDEILGAVEGSNALVLEANHDQESLWSCGYPWHIKKRIAGPNGHLGNHRTKDFIKEICKRSRNSKDAFKYVGAAHVSENSNTYELARVAVEEGFKDTAFFPEIFVAHQREVSQLFEF